MKKWMEPFRSHDGPLTRQLRLQKSEVPALGKVPASRQPNHLTPTICGYCSTGCSLSVHQVEGVGAANLSPTLRYPVNTGMACPKGWEALTPLSAPDRGITPLVRRMTGSERQRLGPQSVGWDQAFRTMVRNFKAIQAEHGPASVAYISTGQIVIEEMALLGAVAKFGMGIVHGDGNTRQCMATAVTAYKQSFGFDAPPYTYADFELSDVIVLIGSNLCIAHPILWQRVLRNPNHPQIVVIDPRRTETAMGATQHYALQPKSDLIFFYGLARQLIELGAIRSDYIEAHTEGFDGFRQQVEPITPEQVHQACGIAPDQLMRLATTIAAGQAVSFWWTMGVNQSHEGTRVAQAIINLALMTGNLGRPGTGANSITGQCNAMGSRLFSNTTNLLGGHDFTLAADREKVARCLHLAVSDIPSQPSWAYDQILDGIDRGEIRGLWIIATNPAHSWIDQDRLKKRLRKLDYLVVQDMYHSTETAQEADLFLPAAGWGEKEGCFINSERRIGVTRKVQQPPGEAMSDFSIVRGVAHYWGCAAKFSEWSSPQAVFQILKRVSRGQPCEITGIEDYAMLEREGGMQWPVMADQPTPAQERRLFEDGRFFHANGRAKFIYENPRALPESPCAEYPFHLLTGRGTSAQWHTQTRTGKSAILRTLYPADLYVEIHPLDAARMGIAPQGKVELTSRRATIQAVAVVTPVVRMGQLFLPMHYPEANRLTLEVVDPYSRQPSYKSCAVAIRRVE